MAERDRLRALPGEDETPGKCPRCDMVNSHDHCTLCAVRDAMPWDHQSWCPRLRDRSEFPDAPNDPDERLAWRRAGEGEEPRPSEDDDAPSAYGRLGAAWAAQSLGRRGEEAPRIDALTLDHDGSDTPVDGWPTIYRQMEAVRAGEGEEPRPTPNELHDASTVSVRLGCGHQDCVGLLTCNDAAEEPLDPHYKAILDFANEPRAPQPDIRDTLMALLGPSHPHDEGRECGTCKAYNLLAALRATPVPASGLDLVADLARMRPYLRTPAVAASGLPTEGEIMERLSAENPKARRHNERTADTLHSWGCVPIRDVVEMRSALLAASGLPSRDAPDPALLGAAIVEHRITAWANEPCVANCGADIAAHYAILATLAGAGEDA